MMALKDDPFWAKVFDRPIAFQRCLIPICGSVTAALMLSQAIYWCQRTHRGDGWFYKTHEEWFDETGLTRHQQVTARKLLRKTGFWLENRRGIPAKLYFNVKFDLLAKALGSSTPTQVVRKPYNSSPEMGTDSGPHSVQHLNSSEITSETTTKNLGRFASKSFKSSLKNRTAQQVRYSIVRRLAAGAAELIAAQPSITWGDLAEKLKHWAAQRDLPYFDAWPVAASLIDEAITIATARRTA
jgi:hypothetical protein